MGDSKPGLGPAQDFVVSIAAEFTAEDFRNADHDWSPQEIRGALQEMGWSQDGDGYWYYIHGKNRVMMFGDDLVGDRPKWVGRWFVEVEMDWERFLADRNSQ